ncbi:unnamed protein product, partial [Effrenium voratum]
ARGYASALRPAAPGCCAAAGTPGGFEARAGAEPAVLHTFRQEPENVLGPEVEHLQERFKDEGTYGGTHRVRNRRCSFAEVSEIQVGNKRLKLETHTAWTVHHSIQRSPQGVTWPKRLWQLPRARDRWERWESLGKFQTDVQACLSSGSVRRKQILNTFGVGMQTAPNSRASASAWA